MKKLLALLAALAMFTAMPTAASADRTIEGDPTVGFELAGFGMGVYLKVMPPSVTVVADGSACGLASAIGGDGLINKALGWFTKVSICKDDAL